MAQEFTFFSLLDDLPVWGLVGETVVSNNQKMLYLYSHIHFDLSKNEGKVIAANLTSENAVLIQEGAEISFTYSVSWSDTLIKSSDRFQTYLDINFYENQVNFIIFSKFRIFVYIFFLDSLVFFV